MATLGIALMPEYPLARYARLAKHAEQLGYNTLWVPDERFWRDVTVCMSQAILATEDIRVGSSVTDPFIRHPALTAQTMATLDEMSGGRVIVGIGAGIAGFKALGIERRRPVTAIREASELMRQLWTGDTVDYQGELVHFNQASLQFRPIRANIPIYIAGRGPKVLALAGEIGEGVMIGSLASEPGLSFAFNQIDEGLSRGGRKREDIESTLWLHTAISADSDAAQEAVRTIITGVLISSLPVLDHWGIDIPREVIDAVDGVTYGVNEPGMQKARQAIGPEVIKHFAAAGNPQQVRDHMQMLVEAGIDHFAILPWRTPGQSMEQFSEQLIEAVSPILSARAGH